MLVALHLNWTHCTILDFLGLLCEWIWKNVLLSTLMSYFKLVHFVPLCFPTTFFLSAKKISPS